MNLDEIDWDNINRMYFNSNNNDEYDMCTWGSKSDIKYLCECLYKIKNAPSKDIATIKETFIIDELQKYMDLSNPSEPKWIEPVRLRLQEKEDWKIQCKKAIEKLREFHFVMMCEQRKNSVDYIMHAGAYMALGDLIRELEL